MSNYYNEYDKYPAAWLRQLITNDQIPDGHIDKRSIIDIEPNDLTYTQHHFFAGIGGWSYALKLARWPEDRPVWTASLPCQPFSVAGKQKGKNDERHLLPHFLELIRECRPDTIFGEQVEGAIRHGWLDDLQTNMEREGYIVGHCVLGAHSVGKAHIRKRLYWVADSGSKRHKEQQRDRKVPPKATGNEQGKNITRVSGVVDTNIDGCKQRCKTATTTGYWDTNDSASGVDWLYCRDNKYRSIKSSIAPLVDGLPRRVVYSRDTNISPNDSAEARAMRLKGYGNAIVPQTAASFIVAFMDIMKKKKLHD